MFESSDGYLSHPWKMEAMAVVVQVDFSENYANKQVNEILSAYFGHDSLCGFKIVEI